MSNYPTRSTEERQRLVENTNLMLLKAVAQNRMVLSADQRVGEKDAAELMGYALGSFRNLRQAKQSPIFYHRPVGASRISYRVSDLAAWLEERREGW